MSEQELVKFRTLCSALLKTVRNHPQLLHDIQSMLKSTATFDSSFAKEFEEAYRAFIGAFDTPLARRKNNNEYAQDARDRLRALYLRVAHAPLDASKPDFMNASELNQALLTDQLIMLLFKAYTNNNERVRPRMDEKWCRDVERILSGFGFDYADAMSSNKRRSLEFAFEEAYELIARIEANASVMQYLTPTFRHQLHCFVTRYKPEPKDDKTN